MQQPHIITFKWLRVIGDTLFAAGTLALVWFVIGQTFGWSYLDYKKTPRQS